MGRLTTVEVTTNSTATKRPRWMLMTGIGALIAFALFAATVAVNPANPFTQAIDDAWRRLVGSDHGPESGPVPMFFQYLGEGPGALVFAIILPVALLITRRWRSALFIFAGLVASTFVSQLTKNLVNRPRPAEDLDNGLFGPLFSVDHGSLPSGHSVTAGFVIVAIAALIPQAHRWIWWIFGAVLAAGMVWQRTLINAHWLSDTIAGLLGGAGVTLILWWAFAPLLDRDRGRPLRRPTASPIEQGAS